MKRGTLKAIGTVLLLLGVIGTLSSWSVTGYDRILYTGTNVLLFTIGAITLFLGYWRSRVQKLGSPKNESTDSERACLSSAQLPGSCRTGHYGRIKLRQGV